MLESIAAFSGIADHAGAYIDIPLRRLESAARRTIDYSKR